MYTKTQNNAIDMRQFEQQFLSNRLSESIPDEGFRRNVGIPMI